MRASIQNQKLYTFYCLWVYDLLFSLNCKKKFYVQLAYIKFFQNISFPLINFLLNVKQKVHIANLLNLNMMCFL